MRFSDEEALRETFGDASFTVGDVRRRTGLPHPKAVVSRLKAQGVLERVGRATYRMAPPDRRLGVNAAEFSLALERITQIPNAVITLPTCLEVHTRGRYSVGRSPTSWPIHVAAQPAHAARVRGKLAGLPYPFGEEGQGVRRTGIFVLFEPDPAAEPQLVDGIRVLSQAEVRNRLAHGHPDESALELIP